MFYLMFENLRNYTNETDNRRWWHVVFIYHTVQNVSLNDWIRFAYA